MVEKYPDIPLSVVIIAYNQAATLEKCLASLPKGAEVIVVDSQSTDNTVDLAQTWGASVFERKFDNFAAQKNFGVDKASHPWVLSIDTDEILDQKLCDNIVQLIKPPTETTPKGFRIKRTLYFMGKKMRFGKTRDFPLRLFQKDLGCFKGVIHEQVKIKGTVGLVRGEISHYSYKNLTNYFNKFNQYTSLIADTRFNSGKRVSILSNTFRFWWEFFSRYILRLGFLDGYPGYTYALCSSIYVYIKQAKLLELQRQQRRETTYSNQTPPLSS